MGTPVGADRLEFLSLVPEAKRDEMLRGAATVSVPAGTIFYRPGQDSRMFIITSGVVRGFLATRDGRQATASFAHVGQALGIEAILGYNPQFSAQALIDSEYVSPNTRHFRKLAQTDEEVCFAVATYLAQQLGKSYRFSTLRALGSMQQRLVYDLLERACDKLSQTRKLEVDASHLDIALSVGTSREVISRAIASLRSARLIETSPNHIEIIDPDAMVKVVSEFVSASTL